SRGRYSPRTRHHGRGRSRTIDARSRATGRGTECDPCTAAALRHSPDVWVICDLERRSHGPVAVLRHGVIRKEAPRMGANGCMRVLVVDQDSALLTAITQLLGEYFSIDAVTTKSDCLDLVRSNEFDVIVAGERLEDGSGLELLGQMGRNRPDMLRIFAVDRERLKLLKGRLGPFRLFRTLSYPIEPRQLLAALSAAAGIEEEIVSPEETVAEAAPAPAPPSPVAVTVRSVRHAAAPVQTRVATATQAMVEAPEPPTRREVHDFTLVDEEPAPPPQPKPRKG